MSFQFLRAAYGEFTHQISCASVVWPLAADTSNHFSYILKSKPNLSSVAAVTERFQFCQNCSWTCMKWKERCNSCAVVQSGELRVLLWSWRSQALMAIFHSCPPSWQLWHVLQFFLWVNMWFLATSEIGLYQLQGKGVFLCCSYILVWDCGNWHPDAFLWPVSGFKHTIQTFNWTFQ